MNESLNDEGLSKIILTKYLIILNLCALQSFKNSKNNDSLSFISCLLNHCECEPKISKQEHFHKLDQASGKCRNSFVAG